MSNFTHHMSLWLDNEPGSYEEMLECVREAIADPFKSMVSIELERRILWKSQALMKELVEDAVHDVLDTLPEGIAAGIVREFVTMGLANVEWGEIAENYIETVREDERFAAV